MSAARSPPGMLPMSSGVVSGIAPGPQPQTGRASFPASGFPECLDLLRMGFQLVTPQTKSLKVKQGGCLCVAGETL